ncbi:hypothetical protein D3C75_914390 [compost metagenome]
MRLQCISPEREDFAQRLVGISPSHSIIFHNLRCLVGKTPFISDQTSFCGQNSIHLSGVFTTRLLIPVLDGELNGEIPLNMINTDQYQLKNFLVCRK